MRMQGVESGSAAPPIWCWPTSHVAMKKDRPHVLKVLSAKPARKMSSPGAS